MHATRNRRARHAERRLGARDVLAGAGSWRRADYPLCVCVMYLGGRRGQPVVQGRSFSGLRTAQMCLIRSPATSNANTVTVTPSCWAIRSGWPLTVRSRRVRPGARPATSRAARATCSLPSIGPWAIELTRPPVSATAVAPGSRRPMRAVMSLASQAFLKSRTRPACLTDGAAGAAMCGGGGGLRRSTWRGWRSAGRSLWPPWRTGRWRGRWLLVYLA